MPDTSKQDTFVFDQGDIKPLVLKIHEALGPVMEPLDKRGFAAFMVALGICYNSLREAGDYHHHIGTKDWNDV